MDSELSSTFLVFIAQNNMFGVFPISPSRLMGMICIASDVAI